MGVPKAPWATMDATARPGRAKGIRPPQLSSQQVSRCVHFRGPESLNSIHGINQELPANLRLSKHKGLALNMTSTLSSVGSFDLDQTICVKDGKRDTRRPASSSTADAARATIRPAGKPSPAQQSG